MPVVVWFTGGRLMNKADRENLCSRRVAREAREKDLFDLEEGLTFCNLWSSLTLSLNVAEGYWFYKN